MQRAAVLLVAVASCLAAGVSAQGNAALPGPLAPSPPCPAKATELPAAALYGLWEARIDDQGGVAEVRLARHPDYEGSVRGTIDRNGVKAQLAGDIDDEGNLNLDESQDGRAIGAVWSGEMQTASCGREFKGIWRNTTNDSTHPFIMRRAGGWQ